MSKISNPGDRPVLVARWTIDAKSSRATHALTGQVVDQLPDQVAKLPIVQSLVQREVLVDEEAPAVSPSPAPAGRLMDEAAPMKARLTQKKDKGE
jgi:hypothetical protein